METSNAKYIQHRNHKIPPAPQLSSVSQLNPVHTLSPYLFITQFNILISKCLFNPTVYPWVFKMVRFLRFSL
jgi:hypothetical protein